MLLILHSVDFEKKNYSAVSNLTRNIMILQGGSDTKTVDNFVKKYTSHKGCFGAY